MKDETKIQNDIRVALSELGFVRRNNVGKFLTLNGVPISVGIKGESDLTLFMRGGEAVFIETKTARGRQSKEQRHFQQVVEKLGYKYIIMRSRDDAERFLERIKNERKGKRTD